MLVELGADRDLETDWRSINAPEKWRDKDGQVFDCSDLCQMLIDATGQKMSEENIRLTVLQKR